MTRAMVARGRGGIRLAGRSFDTHRHEEGQHAAPHLAGASDGHVKHLDYIFDIPLKFAQTLVGFKHDEVTQEPFVVLSRSVPKKGLIGRLFGA